MNAPVAASPRPKPIDRPVGVDEADAPHDQRCAERRDEGRNADPLGEQAVDEADQRRRDERDQEARHLGDAHGLHADHRR